MPVYVYEVIDEAGKPGTRFEVQQSMKEAPLSHHPATRQPVRRVLLAPNLSTRHTPGQESKRLDTRNVEKAGFTKYEKDKLTGQYHRVAGKEGPAVINRPS